MIKRHGQWETTDWPTALQFAAEGMQRVIKQHGPELWASFASPSSTLEEFYLLQKLMRELGVNNVDHRLHQTDFRDADGQPVMPKSTLPYELLEQQESLLIVGCNMSREVPLASIRARKVFRNGGRIYAINPVAYEYPFDVSETIVVSPEEMPIQLAAVLRSLVDDVKVLPEEVQKLIIGITPNKTTQAIAASLCKPSAAIVTGALCENHPHAALLRTLVALLAQWSGARVLRFTTGANSAGGWLSGMIPHRAAAGKMVDKPGLDVQAALNANLRGYLLMAVEAGFDFANPYRARQSMLAAEFVVVLSAYQNEAIKEYAHVILPMAPYAETSGTYINIDTTWQSVRGALAPFDEARPAWKILRVLANLLQCKGFDYDSSEAVLLEIKGHAEEMLERTCELFYPESLPASRESLIRVGEWPLYRSDAIVRHAGALQECAAAESACIRVHPDTAAKFELDDTATVSQGDIEITLPLKRDERMALDVVWVANAMPETVDLGHSFAAITIKR